MSSSERAKYPTLARKTLDDIEFGESAGASSPGTSSIMDALKTQLSEAWKRNREMEDEVGDLAEQIRERNMAASVATARAEKAERRVAELEALLAVESESVVDAVKPLQTALDGAHAKIGKLSGELHRVRGRLAEIESTAPGGGSGGRDVGSPIKALSHQRLRTKLRSKIEENGRLVEALADATSQIEALQEQQRSQPSTPPPGADEEGAMGLVEAMDRIRALEALVPMYTPGASEAREDALNESASRIEALEFLLQLSVDQQAAAEAAKGAMEQDWIGLKVQVGEAAFRAERSDIRVRVLERKRRKLQGEVERLRRDLTQAEVDLIRATAVRTTSR